MEEMERDFVTFTDDDGNDFELDVIDYFAVSYTHLTLPTILRV